MGRHDDDPSYVPWGTVVSTDGPRLFIKSTVSPKELEAASVAAPLTASEALQAVFDFCTYQSLSLAQLQVALAAALLAPTHNLFRRDINLPTPQSSSRPISKSTPSTSDSLRSEMYEDLPHYITLSCTVEVLCSALCGVFWNPGIPCNLCSPWLQPMVDIRGSGFHQEEPGRWSEILAIIVARRAPSLSYLAMGAAVSGLISTALKNVLGGQPPLDPHVYAWMGIPQAFMDLHGKGPYIEVPDGKEYILREDCWRLRRLPPTVEDDLYYNRDPFTPWSPPGYGLLKICPLRVQVHKNCERHTMIYEGVTWRFEDGHTVECDMGKNITIPYTCPDTHWSETVTSTKLPFLGDQEMSENATRGTFGWVLVSGEGKPLEEAYNGPWLRGIGDESEDSADESTFDDESSSAARLHEAYRFDMRRQGLQVWINHSALYAANKEFSSSSIEEKSSDQVSAMGRKIIRT